MPYEYSEEVATADIAFRATAATVEELFIAAADAMVNVMVEELESIQPLIKREINLENESLEMLLFDVLNEIVYYKDAESLLLRLRLARIQQNMGRYTLHAEAHGETIQPDRHRT